MKPYVFVTEDFGESWTNITSNLPNDFSTYVIREDYINPDLLFVGTEEAVHFSYDKGQTWNELMANMPTVAIHDLIIHPREGDLIAGTHGRSIWVLDDISPLREMSSNTKSKKLHLFKSKVATKWEQIFTGRKQPHFEFRGQNPVYGAPIQIMNNQADTLEVQITIKDVFSEDMISWKEKAKSGINRFYWNFTFPYTKIEIAEQKAELQNMLQILRKRIPSDLPQLIQKCETLQKDAKEAENTKALNDIRKEATEYFAGYAMGRPFFGKKRMTKMAKAGKYEVIVQAGKLIEKGYIDVRDDPILK
jgi:hypothetical protein